MGEWKEKYLQLWEKTTKKQRYLAIGGIVLLVLLIAVLVTAAVAATIWYCPKCGRKNERRYYVGERLFTEQEVKLLVDMMLAK